jgi:hypothetical protein
MLRIDILPEKPRSGAADETGNLFDSVLPKGLIDGGIVDQADQVAQLLLVIASVCGCNHWPEMWDRFHSNKPLDGNLYRYLCSLWPGCGVVCDQVHH